MIPIVRVNRFITFCCQKKKFNTIFFIILVEEKITKSLENIIDVKGKVKAEITLLKDKLKLARETIGRFKAELSKVQGNQTN